MAAARRALRLDDTEPAVAAPEALGAEDRPPAPRPLLRRHDQVDHIIQPTSGWSLWIGDDGRVTQERARSLERAPGACCHRRRRGGDAPRLAVLLHCPWVVKSRIFRPPSSASSRPRLRREGDGGVRTRRRGFCSPSSPLALGERLCATGRSAIWLSGRNLAHTKEDEGLEKHTRPYLARQMTELGAPHRETAQAPLCRFGRGR